ncbi:monocopper oxidase-like protein SKU5 isoform X1 [Physcomitrium patens]|uniref:Uncharacterized protein n=2 Tax=Physcomitrium patens TaxID=3218 RepID=A0A7I4FTR9_PHYPA|nr:monocopper oxidase-like protein SKU5 isoform X1 [Physcomitrium patens]|eukprot:XP_024379813.1 monocopper oxidase-like protein SKU5 isoform X1 [Physcomitrella patens]
MNVGMASLHNHVNCERRKSLTKSEFLASWPIVLWIATMMATSVVCALPELISPGDPDIVLVWNVSYITKSPLGKPQQVIVINGELPGPTIVAKTNDVVEVNVFNRLDEPILFTWDGIQHRHNSWQDGVSGTNCEIPSHWNWTYKFQVKDQIGSFFYFPSTRFQRAAGGYGGIRIDSPRVPSPFVEPLVDVFVLIGDWYTRSHKDLRQTLEDGDLIGRPDGVLINGFGPYSRVDSTRCWVLPVERGQTYRLRISNVGVKTTLNFRIQGHEMTLVETEGSYTQQKSLNNLDVHVGQSYSVIVTADQASRDYYIMASPRFENATTFYDAAGVALMHYSDSNVIASGPHPLGPDPDDISFSLEQARSITWNLTAGAARPNPQGSFHYGSIDPSQTFIFKNSGPAIDGHHRFAINNISFVPTTTPLKLADFYNISSGVYTLDAWPSIYSQQEIMPIFEPTLATAVVSGQYKAFVEMVFENNEATLQSWHLDGYAFWVVGMDHGRWSPTSRSQYNNVDAVARCTTQVFPQSWTAVMVMLDNVGVWNLRSENLQRQYLGQELYLRVVNPEVLPMHSPYSETPIPDNALHCGWLSYKQKAQISKASVINVYNAIYFVLVNVFLYCLI